MNYLQLSCEEAEDSLEKVTPTGDGRLMNLNDSFPTFFRLDSEWVHLQWKFGQGSCSSERDFREGIKRVRRVGLKFSSVRDHSAMAMV